MVGLCVDIEKMPNFNASVTDGLKSLSEGKIEFVWIDLGQGIKDSYPYCKVHGAMNKVSDNDGGGIWRCIAFHCHVGCYELSGKEYMERMEGNR